MKFQFLFEEILSDMAMDEARGASDVKFDQFAKTAGEEIAAACDVTINRIFSMPGLQNFKQYISDQRDVDVTDPVSIILNVERFYESWINQLDPKLSNEIHRKTRDWLKQYKEKGKAGRPAGIPNKPKDNSAKAVQGLDYTPNEPEVAAEPEIAAEPKKRGRPALPPELKKVYIPNGRPKGRKPLPPELKKSYVPTGNPKGRPKTKEMTMPEVMAQMRAMQAQIKALKDELDKRKGSFDDDTEPQLAEMNESLQQLKKQYMRFL